MKVGDKVRLLHGTEEGRIINIKNDKIVEVEIEDGFVIPTMKNEVVVIATQEAESFEIEEEAHETESTKSNDVFISEGIYLGIDDTQNDAMPAFILNQTNNTILFSISQNDKKSIKGKSYGICQEYSAKDIGTFTSSIFNESKKLIVHIIIHEYESKLKKQPLVVEIPINKEDLANKTFISSVSLDLALINIEGAQHLDIDPSELKYNMMEKNVSFQTAGNTRSHQKESVNKRTEMQSIDLHHDASNTNLQANEILEYQLNEFEKAYDNALVMNAEKLKIIHGIGAGILRNEIHKRLSRKMEVKFFEDADKERFGFGSTIIYF